MKIVTLVILSILITVTNGLCDERFTNYHTDVEFRHYLHVDGQGIACNVCHAKLKNGLYKMLGHDVCVSCHLESIEVFEVNDQTCGVCHKNIETVGDQHKIPFRMGDKPRGVFAHTEALANICYICHGDMLDEIVERGKIHTRAGRFRIRETAHRFYFAQQCEKCHEGYSIDIMPENHADDWGNKHRELAVSFNCRICHTKSSCQDCHIDIY